MDGQSVKTTERGGVRGFDGHKLVKGRKRHIQVDTLGLPIACKVEPANISDRRAGSLLLGGLGPLFPDIRTVIADAGHESRKLARQILRQRLETADGQTTAARPQDHGPHLDRGAELRLARPQSSIQQRLRIRSADVGDYDRHRKQFASCPTDSHRRELLKRPLTSRRAADCGPSARRHAR
jgi:hypothetical protein